MTQIDPMLAQAARILKPGIPIPAITILQERAGPTRARELESAGAQTRYVAHIVPQVHIDIAGENLVRLNKSGIPAITWFDQAVSAFDVEPRIAQASPVEAPKSNPLRSTPQEIEARIQERLTPARKSTFNPHYKTYLGAMGPILISREASLTSLQDVAKFVRSDKLKAEDHRGRGVKVAVLDTGIDGTHPMLDGKVREHLSFVPEEAGGDKNGHGCVTPDTYVISSLCGSDRIDFAFAEAKSRYGSHESVVENHKAETVSLPAGITTIGLALSDEKVSKGQHRFCQAKGVETELLAIHKIPYTGDLIEILSGGHKFRLTPWHPVLAKGHKQNGSRNSWRYIRADQIGPKMFIAKPKNATIQGPSLDSDSLYLLGYMIGDGHVSAPYAIKNKRTGRIGSLRYRILLSQADFLRDWLMELGHRPYTRKSGDLEITNKTAWKFCVEHGIPQGEKSLIVGLPKIAAWGENLWPLLAGYIDADGSYDKERPRLRMRTSSEKLAKQLVSVLAIKGIHAAIDEQTDTRIRTIGAGKKPIRSNGPSFCVKVEGLDYQALVTQVLPFSKLRIPRNSKASKKDKDCLPVTAIRRVPFDGDLFDLSTGTGNYIATTTAAIMVHNTWCASAIAGKATEYQGMVKPLQGHVIEGMAPDADLIAVKVLTGEGQGAVSGIVAGVEAAIEHGAHILNMSLGSLWGGMGNTPDAQAVNAAADKGLLVAVAAGNSGFRGTIGSPATARGAICVGSVAMRTPNPGAPSRFSSKGPTANLRIRPEIGAPGGNGDLAGILPIDETILAATSGIINVESGDNGYGLLRGSSMATPCVAGVLAQLLPLGFPKDRDQAEATLKAGARKGLIQEKDNTSGWGVIDAVATLEAIRKPPNALLAGLTRTRMLRRQPFLGAVAGSLTRLRGIPGPSPETFRLPLV